MNRLHRRRTVVTLFALACALPAPLVSAQTPMRVILPVGPGSGVDTIVRAIQPGLAKALGQPVVIENIAGAGGIPGTAALVKAAPDGNTIGVVSNNHVINPHVFKSMPFDSIADITPISVLGATPFVLVVNPKVPASNVRQLIDFLKAKPGAYNYASSGNGTIIHLAGAMFVDQAGVDVKHIPYKGVGPMVTDLIGGQVEFGVVALPAVQGHIKSGALRAIESGYITREIQESAWKFQREVESKERVVVGVNEFATNEAFRGKMLRVDPRVREEQAARLRALRERRDNARVENTLNALHDAARGTTNLMPAILDCVEAYATLGEICDTLRKEFGEYRGGALF
jgi:hypothetical protein